jgi:hypothetical protein
MARSKLPAARRSEWGVFVNATTQKRMSENLRRLRMTSAASCRIPDITKCVASPDRQLQNLSAGLLV